MSDLINSSRCYVQYCYDVPTYVFVDNESKQPEKREYAALIMFIIFNDLLLGNFLLNKSNSLAFHDK